MITENIMFSIGIFDGEQYKFFYTDNKEFLYNRNVIRCRNVVKDNSIQTFFVFDEYSFENLYIDNKGVICYTKKFCKHCNSTDVICKDFNTREVFNSRGELKTLKLKRYKCKKCGRKSQVELLGVYEPYCKFSNDIKEKFGLFLHNGHKTLRQPAKDLKLFFKSSISHETFRKSLMSNKDELYKKWDFELSGYCSYDAQWIPKDKKFEFRLVLIDIVKYLPIAEAIVKSEDDETVYDFIIKSMPYHKRKAIVTDSKKSYDSIMSKLGFKYHQHCVFHLLQRINNLINDEVNDYMKEFKTDLKKTNPNYSDAKIKKLTKKAGKEYRKQFGVYHDEIKSIFDCEKYEDAVSTIESIRKKMDKYPEFLSKYLIKNFFPEYKKYIVYLKSEVNNHLDKTNNKNENYIGKIIDKKHKGKFKTMEGFFDYILHRIDGWIEDHQPTK